MTKATAKKWIALACFLSVLDAAAKYFALAYLAEDKRVAPFFDLLLYKNPGIAFSLPVPLPLIIFLSAVVLLVLPAFIQRSWHTQPVHSLAGSCIFLGAAGNAVDRIIHGFTTDYLVFFGHSVINLSDILIVSGFLLLFVYSKKEG